MIALIACFVAEGGPDGPSGQREAAEPVVGSTAVAGGGAAAAGRADVAHAAKRPVGRWARSHAVSARQGVSVGLLAAMQRRFGLGPEDELSMLEDGRLHIIDRCVAPSAHRSAEALPSDETYVPWYLLGSSTSPNGTCGPPTFGCAQVGLPVPWPGGTGGIPGPFVAPTSAPYELAGGPPYKWNPNRPPVNPLHKHLNVTRHWAQEDPIEVVVLIPNSVGARNGFPSLSPGGAGLAEAIAYPHFALVPAPPPAGYAIGSLAGTGTEYTWQQFYDDVVSTFGTYAGVTTAQVAVNVSWAYDPYGFDLINFPRSPLQLLPFSIPQVTGVVPEHTQAPIAAAAGGVFVWDNRSSAAVPRGHDGPTGNGRNEVVFLQYNSAFAAGGFCSMLVDPATGVISEADVIFEFRSFSQLALIGGGNLGVGTPMQCNPRETTALRHEIGHFFGLDHSNLHDGSAAIPMTATPPVTQNPVSAIVGVNSLSLFSWPVTPATMWEYPGMVSGIITTQGTAAAPYNHVTQSIHDDDAAALSVIYPVTAAPPSPSAMAKVPLINRTGIIKGRALDGMSGLGAYGHNVLVYRGLNGGTTTPPAPPLFRSPPVIGVVAGFHRERDSDVVGAIDAVSQQPSSGVFVIEGVPINPNIPGVTPYNPDVINGEGRSFDIVIEPLEYSGITPTVNFAEWVFDSAINAGGATSSTTNTWTPTGLQTAIQSSVPMMAGVPGPCYSIELAAGTVIDLDAVKLIGGFNSYSVSRPLVEIVPRTFRPLPTAPITIRATACALLARTTAVLTVNGVPVTLPAPVQINGIDDTILEWTVTLGGIGAPAGAARLRFSVQEQAPPAVGWSVAPGINEVQY